ncbi:juvenile hormone acid O-methyltransferase isoform X2 [Rhipicephalus sanguineus]|uniref:juvenile hormone acid O-methyltransferase isoform X2 n=1 Tax=Rhipicephalus sanguineus TaxID=34632 RepID=UPI001893A70E|nr:juvenile hormone acid O-methyltransferase isoform X2 [Rhipicephalus sanguineus]
MTSQVTGSSEPAGMRNYTGTRKNEEESETVNLSAGRYSKSNTLQRRFNILVLDVYQERFISKPRATHQVLDVGCGTGDFTRDVILPRCLPCRRIVGVDSSGEMIEHARRYSASEKLNFRLLDICDDVTDFLEEFGRFDRVYSFFCLHWALDLGSAVKNVARLMTQNGECLLVFYASHEAVPVWRALANMERWKKYSDSFTGLAEIRTEEPGHGKKGADSLFVKTSGKGRLGAHCSRSREVCYICRQH